MTTHNIRYSQKNTLMSYPKITICFCIKYKCYILIELTFLKELMLIRQMNQKSVIFVIVFIFLDKRSKFEQYICNGCHDLSKISMNLSNTFILNIHGVNYRCIISGINVKL